MSKWCEEKTIYCVRVREDGVLMSSREEAKEVWKRHFECLMNTKTEGEAIVSSMGIEAGRKSVRAERN